MGRKYCVRLQHDGNGWAYSKRCLALQKYAPDDFDVSIGAWHIGPNKDPWPDERWDLVLQLVPDHPNVRAALDARGMTDTILVAGLNVGYAHSRERLRMCSDQTDHIVVNNYGCYDALGKPEGMTHISNGVDLETYRVTIPPAKRRPRVLWLGGKYHCAGPGQKGTSIKGWHEILLPLADKLVKWGIEVDFCQVESLKPKPGEIMDAEALVEFYNSGTIYVCASSSEGTPNPALEAAACGCVVVSTRVGNMMELIDDGLNGCLVDRTTDSMTTASLLATILHCHRMPGRIAEMASAMREEIQSWHWKERSKQYFRLFRELIGRGRKKL